MTLKLLYSALLAALPLCAPKAATGDGAPLRESVMAIQPAKWQRQEPQGQFADETRYMLRMNNRYAMNKWYDEVKRFNGQKGRYLEFGGTAERYIRPVAHMALNMAISLKTGAYDPDFCHASRREATKRTLRLISSLAHRHKANSGTSGWGDQWQSALWASSAAEAAWLMWDKLEADDREAVCRMTVHEADRFIDYRVPYYRDIHGTVISKGDTKAEENAWNSNILAAATAMMPAHPHYDKWMYKLKELQLSAYAMPEDTRKAIAIDGLTLNRVLNGSNMNTDGTVINHNIMHPDYMVAFMHNAINAWIYELAGRKRLQSSVYNGDVVYDALTERLFNGKTLYQKTPDGKASPLIYYPEGNDWGLKRQVNYWLMDVMADIYGWDRGASVKAIEWAAARNREMLQMFGRDTTGQYYQDRSENTFDSREEWDGAQIAWGYLGLWLDK